MLVYQRIEQQSTMIGDAPCPSAEFMLEFCGNPVRSMRHLHNRGDSGAGMRSGLPPTVVNTDARNERCFLHCCCGRYNAKYVLVRCSAHCPR